MELNSLEQNIGLENNINIEKEQNKFLETNIGKAINTGIDIGIRSLFPDFIEDQIINIKDNLLNYGLNEGIQRTVKDAIDLGKSAIGIFTGEFENISQMQNAVKSGGIIDGISSVLNLAIDTAEKSGIINNSISNVLKQGKNAILNNVENNIEKSFNNQSKAFENMERYIDNWNKSFKEENFENMEREYKKIEKQMKDLVPLEKVIEQAHTIENLHNLIKNNGKNFNLSNQELELVKKLK